jgi:RNA polymerase sigma factor (sigma-70 family)
MSYLRTRSDLLQRFRDGEPDAMAEVYRAYMPRLASLLQRGFVVLSSGMRIPPVSSGDDRADVIHDVFARAFQHEARRAYDGERDYWPYLAMIARNILISHHRRRGREALGADSDVSLELEIVEYDVDEAQSWLEPRSLEITRQYVSTLPEPMRAVHAALYVLALSQRDAAQKLGLSRPKVRKLERRLRQNLLGLLNRAGFHAEDAEPGELEINTGRANG